MSDIKINSHDWNKLSKEDQNKIIKIIRETGLIENNETIVPDVDGRSTTGITLKSNPIKKKLCKIACSTGEAVAIAACGELSGPLIPVCIVAAQVAADECRDAC